MTSRFLLSVTSKSRLTPTQHLPRVVTLGAGVSLIVGVLWWLVLQPIQQTLELRLYRYPSQLLSIQDLNRTLLTYQDKDVSVKNLSESGLTALQQSLFSQGIKFTLHRVENTDPVKLELKIEEIEFSRWLALIADFRQTSGLYVTDIVIKKKDGVGVIQLVASLVQTP